MPTAASAPKPITSARLVLQGLLVALLSVFHVGCSESLSENGSMQDDLVSDQLAAAAEPVVVSPPIDAAKEFANTIDQIAESKSDGLMIDRYRVNDEMLSELSRAPTIETMLIDRGEVTDAGAQHIAELTKLRHLRLRQSPIGDEGLEWIAKCDSIWFLNLPQANCTAAGVAKLQTLTELRNLRLGSPKLDNDVCDQIAKIKSLQSIHLIGVPVNDAGLKQLASLPNLESLYLDDSAVSDAGWKWLFQEHPDLHIHIDQNHHDRDRSSHKHE